MTHDQFRNRLDNWRFWVGVAYFGIVCTVVGLYFVNQRTSRTLAEQAAAATQRSIETRSEAEAAFKACVGSIPLLENFRRHVLGVNDGFATLVTNSRQGLLASDPADPLYPVRVRNLIRLEKAAKDVAAVKTFPVPTQASCAARRNAALDR